MKNARPFSTGLTLALAILAASAQHPWPTERFDRYGSAKAPVGPSVVVPPWLVARLGGNNGVTHGPAISENGFAYFGTLGSENQLNRASLNSPEVIGTFPGLELPKSTPLIGSDGTIYFTTHRNFGGSTPGRLYAINPNTMDFNWFFTTNSNHVNDFSGASPISGADNHLVVTSSTGQVWKLNSNTGAVIWTQNVGQVDYTPRISRDDSSVIVSNGTSVASLDYSTGNIEWQKNLGSKAGSPGVAPNGNIVVGSQAGFVYGLDPVTGDIEWTFAALNQALSAPAFDGDSAYICSNDRRLYKLDTTTGVKAWSFVAEPPGNDSSPIVGHDGRVYFCNFDGDLYSISPAGSEIWKVNIGGGSKGPFSIDSDGTLYVACAEGPKFGLNVISQLPALIYPDGFSVPFATHTGGNLDSLLSSDNNRLEVGINEDSPRNVKLAALQCSATFPASDAHEFMAYLEVSAVLAPLEQSIRLWNFDTGQWEVIDTREASAIDEVVEFSISSDAGRFIGPSNQVRIQILFTLESRSRAEWKGRVDVVRFLVNPKFET